MILDTVRWLAAVAMTAAHFAAAAQASPERASTEQVAVRLISEAVNVAPGQTVYLGLEQKIIPHWHTDWKNPGDSGTSTDVGPITNPGETRPPTRRTWRKPKTT